MKFQGRIHNVAILALLLSNVMLLLLVNSLLGNGTTSLPAAADLPYQERRLSEFAGKTTSGASISSPLRATVSDANPFFQNVTTHSVRQWGCDRTETPFVFVHIGKAGGGSVRGRLAGSSVNYKDDNERGWQKAQGHYYPIHSNDHNNDTIVARVRLCNSCFSNRRPSTEKTFEKTVKCHAATPIGQAIACPEGWNAQMDIQHKIRGECGLYSTSCNLVYLGHNVLGAEMHWLPHRYLSSWWNKNHRDDDNTNIIPWQKLDPRNIWCDYHDKNLSRPQKTGVLSLPDIQEHCGIPLARSVDALASQALSSRPDHVVDSWAPLYASLPVLRVTVMRDPFSWIMSKYFWWLDEKKSDSKCDNIPHAVHPSEEESIYRVQRFKTGNIRNAGWLTEFVRTYLMYLCGTDCLVRYAQGRANLADIERQAEENLRHSFAVVGILDKEGGMEDFFKMINARVQYMDTTLNPGVAGDEHTTSSSREANRCKQVYKDPVFQQQLLKASPELRALNRLYQVALEVNKSQKDELKQCASWKD